MKADVTLLLESVNAGETGAYSRLLEAIHSELHKLAASKMRREREGHTLQPTVLVNEAYLRLAGKDAQWENRSHFFSAAAEAMRRILIDHARQRASGKRGGGARHVTFSEMNVAAEDPDVDLLALDDAIRALEAENARLSQVVQLRYFAGLSIDETAQLLEIAPATVKRDWTFARAWLYERMSDSPSPQ